MKLRLLATRYAKALFAQAVALRELDAAATRDHDELTVTHQELNVYTRLFQHQPRFHHLLLDPKMPSAEKIRILRRAAANAASRTVLPLIEMLIRKSRTPLLPLIRGAFERIYREYRRVVHVTVRSAVPLHPGQTARLEAVMRRRTCDATIEMHEIVDPKLLGGLTIEYQEVLIDSTIKTRLTNLKDKLLRLHRDLLATIRIDEVPDVGPAIASD